MARDSDGQALARFSVPQRILIVTLRIFFRLLYHQLAWTYDGVAWLVSLGNWQRWVLAALPYLHGPNVLEIGFGPGHLQLALLQKKLAAFGLDESPQMVRLANKRLLQFGLRPGLMRGEARSIPLADGSIHQVVLTFPAEFIFSPQTTNEIRRVLVPGGEAVIIALAWLTGRTPWERLVAWINRITGQAPAWNPGMLERLKVDGFDIRWEMVKFPNSMVVVIRMNKI